MKKTDFAIKHKQATAKRLPVFIYLHTHLQTSDKLSPSRNKSINLAYTTDLDTCLLANNATVI